MAAGAGTAAYGDVAQLDNEQKGIIRAIITIGRTRARRQRLSPLETRKMINTALAVGYTESRWRNLPGGDRDSQGWRQERAMYYSNPRDVTASINRFYDEYFADANPHAALGVRAQAVQQSGTPHVWDSLAPLADRIRREFGGGLQSIAGIKGAPGERGRGGTVDPDSAPAGEVITNEHRSTILHLLVTIVFVWAGLVIVGFGVARGVGLRRRPAAGAV